MRTFTVYLFQSPQCNRGGWLPYVFAHNYRRATVTVIVEAMTGAKAKNAAVTAANRGWVGVKVISLNETDPLWGIHNFPTLEPAARAALARGKETPTL